MRMYIVCLVMLLAGCVASRETGFWPQYERNPFVVQLDIPGPLDTRGSLVVADLDNDGLIDYLVTGPGHVAAYANSGRKLWIRRVDIWISMKAENNGLPGHHGPGVQAADIDGDGKTEALFLTQDGAIHVVDGASGKDKWHSTPPKPTGAKRWEHLVVANFRGKGDRDLLLQATNAKGYRKGRYVSAYRLEDLKQKRFEPLWKRDDFVACAHNGARVADLDGDGMDEVLGGMVLSADGRVLYRLPDLQKGAHLDAVYVADVRPDIPGLEVIALEEGDQNRVFVFNRERLIWDKHFKHQEPQNAAVGEFDPERPGLEVWCRSRYDQHQKPFVFDAEGKKIVDYRMDDVKPKGWTISGVEVPNKIDWTGEDKQFVAVKERHESGDVGIFDPVGGRFLDYFEERADRLYVADVSGDWREEIIVLNVDQLHIYHNEMPNPNPDRPRLWTQNHYRRSKMTWNYYSP